MDYEARNLTTIQARSSFCKKEFGHYNGSMSIRARTLGFLHLKRPIYLDYASTTPVRPEVARAMNLYGKIHFGNPASRHSFGYRAKDGLEESRRQVARVLGVKAEGIVFTSGGTEANNLAIFGVIEAHLSRGKDMRTMHAITSAIEHVSVLESFRELERRGLVVTYLTPDADGVIHPEAVRKALRQETVLVSIMYVNNEVGTIEPIREIATVLAGVKEKVVFHTDASQAPLYLPIVIEGLGVDLLSADSQKIYGPKGVGFLYIKRGVRLHPRFFGGSHEGGLRPGTPPVALIVGAAEAFRLASAERTILAKRVGELRDEFLVGIKKNIKGAALNGHPKRRIPNNLNISVQGVDAEYLAAALDARGVAVSTKSACLPEENTSYVLSALGDSARAGSSVRFTLGRETTARDLRRATRIFCDVVARMRKFDIKKSA